MIGLSVVYVVAGVVFSAFAVLSALDHADWSALHAHPAWAEIEESNPVMTFQLTGDVDLVCQRPAVTAAAVATPEASTPSGWCLVDGVKAPIQRLHPAIKVFSLPSVDHPEYGRHIELGVKGPPAAVEVAYADLVQGLKHFKLRIGPELVRN